MKSITESLEENIANESLRSMRERMKRSVGKMKNKGKRLREKAKRAGSSVNSILR